MCRGDIGSWVVVSVKSPQSIEVLLLQLNRSSEIIHLPEDAGEILAHDHGYVVVPAEVSLGYEQIAFLDFTSLVQFTQLLQRAAVTLARRTGAVCELKWREKWPCE
jgi:hypothetical protein